MLGKRPWDNSSYDRTLPELLDGGLGMRRLDGSEIAMGYMMDVYERDMQKLARDRHRIDEGVSWTMKTFSELIAEKPLILPMMIQQALLAIQDPLSRHFPTVYIDTDHWQANTIRFEAHQAELSVFNTNPRVHTYKMSQKSGHLDFFMLGFLFSRQALLLPEGEMMFKALVAQLRTNFYLGTITEVTKSIFNAAEYYAKPHMRYGREGIVPTSVVAVMAHRRRKHGAFTKYANAVETGIDFADAVMGQEYSLPTGILMSSEMRHFLSFGRDRLVYIAAGSKATGNARQVLQYVKVKNDREVQIIVSPEVPYDEEAQFGCDPYTKSQVATGGFAMFKNVAFSLTDPNKYTSAMSDIYVPDVVTNDFAKYSLLRCIETCPWFVGRKEDFPVHANLPNNGQYIEGHLDKKLLKGVAERLIGKEKTEYDGRLYDVNTRTDYTSCPDDVDVFIRFGKNATTDKWEHYIVERIGEMAVARLPNEHLLFMAKCLNNEGNEDMKKRLDAIANGNKLKESGPTKVQKDKLDGLIFGLSVADNRLKRLEEIATTVPAILLQNDNIKGEINLDAIDTLEKLIDSVQVLLTNVFTAQVTNIENAVSFALKFLDFYRNKDNLEYLLGDIALETAKKFISSHPNYRTENGKADVEIPAFTLMWVPSPTPDAKNIKVTARVFQDTDDAAKKVQKSNFATISEARKIYDKYAKQIHPILQDEFVYRLYATLNDVFDKNGGKDLFVTLTISEKFINELNECAKEMQTEARERIPILQSTSADLKKDIEILKTEISAIVSTQLPSFISNEGLKRKIFANSISAGLKQVFETIINLPITLDVFSMLTKANVPLPILGMLLEDSQTQTMTSVTYLADDIGNQIIHSKGLMESVHYYPEPEDKYRFSGSIMFGASVLKDQGVFVQENAFGGPVLGGFGNRFINQRDNNTFYSHLHSDFNTNVLPRVGNGIIQKQFSKVFVPAPIVSPDPNLKVFSTTGYYDPQKFCLEMQVQGNSDFMDTTKPHYVSQTVANQIYKFYTRHPRNGVVYSSISPQMRKTLAVTNSVVALMPTKHYSSMTMNYEIGRSEHLWGKFGRNVRHFLESKIHTSSINYTQEEAYHNPEEELTVPN